MRFDRHASQDGVRRVRYRGRPVNALCALGVVLLGAPALGQEGASGGGAVATDCFREVVTTLAADDMEGRGVGTEGLERAADYLSERFRAAGLEDGGVGYRQPFEVLTGVELGEGNRLAWRDEALVPREDFVPMGFSSSGSFSGEVVFAGYGIRAGELGYDDYAGLDVEGRVVLALRYEPGEDDEDGPFDGRRPTRWSDLRYKALLAREAGASALIFVEGPGEVGPDAEPEPDRLPVLRAQGPTSQAGLPVLQVTRAVAQRWLGASGLSLTELQQAIDRTYSPQSAALGEIEVSGAVDLVPTRASVRNVLGVLPGQGALADQVVVVGAHYDHLGYGGRGSMVPDRREIHNGADDNASGVSAMVCGVAGVVRGLGGQSGDRRTLVAAAFSAEEIGLGGSGWYVDHPLFPIEQTVAMVNLDMVGRVREGRLSVLGTDSAPEWDDLLEPVASGVGLQVDGGGDGYGPSDQTPFYEREVPVVHLFSGAHEQYHTPDDDADTLNMEGGGQVAELLEGLLTSLLTAEAPPTYVRSTSGPLMSGDSRSYGAYFGSIPDYTAMMGAEGGVLLAGVRAGGPAERAGVQAGDVVVEMAGMEIQNLYDLTYALRDHRPGETVEVIVVREGERIRLAATLEQRGESSDSSGSPHGSPHAQHEPTSMPGSEWSPTAGEDASALLDPRETHLADLRQLTFGGENAEAYFSPDGRRLIFQRTPPEGGCDQQYLLDLDTGEVTLLSSGRGRTTCGYFSYPDGDRYIYATTEGVDAACPPPPDRSAGYVWGLYDYDLVWQESAESPPEPFLPDPGYDAEATACMVDGRIVFTSTRSGDLDLFVVGADGSNLQQLTDTPGYDGGAFFTADCSRIVWRASRPEGEALDEYRELLERRLVRPGSLEIFVMDADGSDVRQLTDNRAANFAPYPTPDGRGVLYSSNAGDSPREFDLWLVDVAGGEPERVTHAEQFDGFPMFSPDGRWLVFASNRGATGHQTNLFIARWIP